MQQFMIGPMCVTKEEFEQQLNSCGLKFGYIKRLYEKWKAGDLIYYRILIEGSPFVIVTDDESSYPEIQEDSEKEIEPYSLEWLENLFYQSTIVGPISYESLLPQLRDYIRVKKAEQIDETAKQNKCPYCHDFDGHGPDLFKCNIEDATASIDIKENAIVFDNSDGSRMSGTFKIKLCPMCGRKLEA